MEDEKESIVASKRSTRMRPLVALFAAVIILVILVIIYWAIWADSSPSWTGFGTYDEEAAGPRAKTLWDWLGLLIVPAALAVGAFWLNRSQKETELKIAEKARKVEREIADSRQKQATLESYYDRMTELLLAHGLRESDTDSEVRSITRARTVAVVKSLDAERNKQLFGFLKESKLIEQRSPIINLQSSDISGADLREADLFQIDLSVANLTRTNFAKAMLDEAILVGSVMVEATLIEAELMRANLTGADITNANLDGSVLIYANLSSARLSHATLKGARLYETNLNGALLDGANLSWAALGRAILINADLREANLNGADLTGAVLEEANLKGANLCDCKLINVNLSGANLNGTYLKGADLNGADLSGAVNWRVRQFDIAKSLVGTKMPDGVQLMELGWFDGPTYEEWKAQYLTKQGEQEVSQ